MPSLRQAGAWLAGRRRRPRAGLIVVKAAPARHAHTARMVERIQGWRCIGCGKVDAPRPCIGVCQDRRAELVLAADYDAVIARVEALEAFAKLIAHLTPRDGEWEASWRALQGKAQRLLEPG